MNEILFIFILLLPVAWLFGMLHGRKKVNRQQSSNDTALSKTYFTGLNYLLNEESDKAIDTFVSMLEVDSETVETHLALGSLFRKRGEGDRAIRIHQNLIARPSLSQEDRKKALFELGYDYMAAGLLDRAENIFKELSSDIYHKDNSLSQLLVIYQQTKDWKKAISTASNITAANLTNHKVEIAHFYCELAEDALRTESYREALSCVKKAFQADPSCARAILISADIHISKGRSKQAIKCYRDLIKHNVSFLPEAIDKVINCFEELADKPGLLRFLDEAITNGAGISSILAYAKILQQEQGDKAAAEFIAEKMSKHPSIKGLLELIRLHIQHASESAKPSLQMLYRVVDQLLKNKPIYHCDHCGFDSKMLFWQCPSCRSWGEVKPIRGIEGD
jgi:lipopolysaccharide assembly protein B